MRDSRHVVVKACSVIPGIILEEHCDETVVILYDTVLVYRTGITRVMS